MSEAINYTQLGMGVIAALSLVGNAGQTMYRDAVVENVSEDALAARTMERDALFEMFTEQLSTKDGQIKYAQMKFDRLLADAEEVEEDLLAKLTRCNEKLRERTDERDHDGTRDDGRSGTDDRGDGSGVPGRGADLLPPVVPDPSG